MLPFMKTPPSIAAPLAFLASLIRCNVVTLPFHDEHSRAVLLIDRQPFSFLVDSGSARFFVIHGNWFERRYGPGSCEVHSTTCYFCTAEAPCDDIATRHKFTVKYDGDNEVYEYVEHSGTLHLDQTTVKVSFGLVVHYIGDHLPRSILGLSFGRPNIPKTLLQQLKDSNVIGALSFSMLARNGEHGDFGKVLLGDSERKSEDVAHLLLKPWNETSKHSYWLHETRRRAHPSRNPSNFCSPFGYNRHRQRVH
ncbi:hypothetical protein FOZ63_021143 [Perkinsus olseni]|uniref:Peptidase A1 domain-containing protein n=1 Tax=Perkinsus olseni TaxID=32597 RepID=A0A7J6SY61_PEROL|nr:hypothetical protein FOZ62_003788 [Perkinsus olseni]KAF4745407.1 hypothetical protein FOZ63_021143 [Perkinsus olseni]